MLNFLKNRKKSATEAATPSTPEKKPGLFKGLQEGLQRTRTTLAAGLGNILLGKKQIDKTLLDDLETLLLSADVGVTVTNIIIQELTTKLARKELDNPDALYATLHTALENILLPCEKPLEIPDNLSSPFVLLMVGVNGAGKTTTIGKLAKQFKQQGKKVMLAAGDTFRAAAIEQLKVWGERNAIPVIAQHSGADSAAVLYDALSTAKAKNIEVLLADTAGRLHTKENLMDELKKIKRTLQKLDPNAPHEMLLVLDATTGQNALNQAKQFHEAIGVTGICITKLDGTAKGGIIFAIAKQLALPIRFIGVGESIEDLKPFNAQEFVEALFEE
jgi:fused signal recognition particle receptor